MATAKWLFVNLLTFSRTPLSYYCCILALLDQWLIAAILSVIATLTDVFDGLLAKKWKVGGKFGYYFDKTCDLFMVVALSAGLKNVCPWYLYLIFTGLHFILWSVITTRSENDRYRRLCRAMSCYHSIAIMLTLNIFYSIVALGDNSWWLLSGIPILFIIWKEKKYRLLDMSKGQG